MAILTEELVQEFGKAIIINFDDKTVLVIKDKKIKVYGEEYFKELLNSMDYFNFDDGE